MILNKILTGIASPIKYNKYSAFSISAYDLDGQLLVTSKTNFFTDPNTNSLSF